ncbi:TPA: hypothetical protein HLY69_13445 [Escherichia coli]|nr:hypothetical protein [Escherichia coli]
MIGRLLRGGFMTAIYAYLYIPIIILIVNSFNSSRFGINWQGFTTKWYSLLMNNDSLYEILPLKIYSMVKVGVSPEVNALATILLVLSLVMVIASQLIARDKTKGNTGDVK